MGTIQATVTTSAAIPLSIRLYGDIITRERPVHQNDVFSRKHPRMSQLNRAKLFAPFAALDGFEGRVRGKEVPYVNRHELDADEEWELNRRLGILYGLTYNSKVARTNRVNVRVEYFEVCHDPENDAYGIRGLYHTITGIVQRVDFISQTMAITDMYNDNICGYNVVPFADIYSIIDPQDRLFRIVPNEQECESP